MSMERVNLLPGGAFFLLVKLIGSLEEPIVALY